MSPRGDWYGGKVVAIVVVLAEGKATVVVAATSDGSELHAVIVMPRDIVTTAASA
jgi:hypothetical protein